MRDLFKKTLLTILLGVYSFFCFSQHNLNIDTSKVLFSAKIEVFADRDVLFTPAELDSLAKQLTAKVLKSKGFQDIIFIHISWRSSIFDSAYFNKTQLSNNQVLSACNYIQAYMPQNGCFYKLKGFRINEFINFIEDFHYFNEGMMIDIMLENKKVFLQLFEVEELDLGCLYDAFYKNKKCNICYCLISCDKRDDEMSSVNIVPKKKIFKKRNKK